MSEPTAIARAKAPQEIPGYRLEQLIGRGGMGEVYKGVQLSLSRPVAVKLLATELATDPAFVARFEKEAAALAALSHPAIVAIVDRGRTAETCYLVMEFVDGVTLREVITRGLPDWTSAVRLTLQVCQAIEYAHGRGIIHRDLKPENILIDTGVGGVPKVTDFGLAGFIEKDGKPRYNLTQTNMGMGTLDYMAPEQRTDAKNADGRADLYALGVILYELLVGEVPRGSFDPPSVRKPGIDARLDAIVARCLKVLPADRYQTMRELIAALEEVVPISLLRALPAPTALQKVKRSLSRAAGMVWRTATGLVLIAALVLLAADGYRLQRPKLGTWQAIGAAPLVGELKPMGVLDAKGRLEIPANGRRIELGSGTTTLPLLARGRPLTQRSNALVFEGTAGAGRASPEVADLSGDSLTYSAVVTAPEAPEPGPILELLLGAREAGRGGLLLLGDQGTYLALLVSAHRGPAILEWRLGERQGLLVGRSPTTDSPAVLQLSVSADGMLEALVEQDGGHALLKEELPLGAGWKTLFGAPPKPAMGCINAGCEFRSVRYEIRRTPPVIIEPVEVPVITKAVEKPAPVAKKEEPPKEQSRPSKADERPKAKSEEKSKEGKPAVKVVATPAPSKKSASPTPTKKK